MHLPPDIPEGDGDGQRARVRPQEVDFEAVARISTQAGLKNIRLGFLHADWTERDGAIPGDWAESAGMGISTDAVLIRATSMLIVECGFIAVYAPGLDENSDELPNPKDAPVELHARFELLYELKDLADVQDTDPEHFALANGVLHAWPYWRELAHTTTMRMGLAPLLVGTVKIPWIGDPDQKGSDEPVDEPA